MALDIDGFCCTGELATKMGVAFNVSANLGRLGFKNENEAIGWFTDCQSGEGLSIASVREPAAQYITDALSKTGVIAASDIITKADPYHNDPAYRQIKIPSGKVDLAKLDALVWTVKLASLNR